MASSKWSTTVDNRSNPGDDGLRGNHTFRHSLAFVLGFGLIFIALGISAGALGLLIPGLLPIVRRVGGITLILFGLIMIGAAGWLQRRIQSWPKWQTYPWSRATVRFLEFGQLFLYADRRVQWQTRKRAYSASFLTGIIFSAGWSPCLGPILSAILLLAAGQQTVSQAAALMVVYTAGLAIPFLIAGAALGRMSNLVRRMNRHGRIISFLGGGFLIFTGWLLFSNRLLDLSAEVIYLFGLGFGLEETLLGAATISFPLAFLAGILSFFSPCVLPLIPAYIGYMSGTALGSQSSAGGTIGATPHGAR